MSSRIKNSIFFRLLIVCLSAISLLIAEEWNIHESFENNNFNGIPDTLSWVQGGDADWTIDTNASEGTYSARSGAIEHNETSSISTSAEIPYLPGSIKFSYKLESEDVYDYLKFYVNGSVRGQWSGVQDWADTTFALTPGNYEFKWEYAKYSDPGTCGEGQLSDCSGDGDCCIANWATDTTPDCLEQQYGCDLTCYESDGGTCSSASSVIDAVWIDNISIIGHNIVVNAGTDFSQDFPHDGSPGGEVQFDGTSTYPDENANLSIPALAVWFQNQMKWYSIDDMDNLLATGPNPSISLDCAMSDDITNMCVGEHDIVLKIAFGSFSEMDTVHVSITEPNQPPILTATSVVDTVNIANNNGIPGNSTWVNLMSQYFDQVEFSDPDVQSDGTEDPLLLTWSDSEGNALSPLQSVTAGDYIYRLTATDPYNSSANISLSLTMIEVNEIPIVSIAAISESDIGLNQNSIENQEVQLFGFVEDEDNCDGSCTDADVVSYLWSCTQEDGISVDFTDDTSINTSFTSPLVSTNLETETVICTLQATDPFQVISETNTLSEPINITVYNDNQAPVVSISSSLKPSVNEGSSIDVQLSELISNDFISVSDIDNDLNFTLEIDAGDNYTLDNSTITPISEFYGELSIPIRVSDGFIYSGELYNNLSETVNLIVEVVGINDPPILDGPTVASTEEEMDVIITGISVTDADVDGINHNYHLKYDFSTANGTITLNQTQIVNLNFTDGCDCDGQNDATISFTAYPQNFNIAVSTITFHPFPDYFGPDGAISITVNDQGNFGLADGTDPIELTDSHTIDITIDAINDPPGLILPTLSSSNEDTEISILGISISDEDIEEDDMEIQLSVDNGTITLSSINGLMFSLGDGYSDESLIFSGSINNISNAIDPLIFMPDENFNGDVQLVVEVNDLGGTGAGGPLTVTENLLITVNPVNDNPTAIDDTGTTDEDTAFTSNVMSNDFDLDSSSDNSPDNHFSLTVNSVPITDVQNGILTLSIDGEFTYEPNANYFGTDTFVYELSDGAGSNSQGTVNIIVSGVNDAPILTIPTDKYTEEDTPIDISGIIFSDIDIGDSDMKMELVLENSFISLADTVGLKFLSSDSDSLSFTGTKTDILNATTIITFIPENNYNGEVSVEVIISDIVDNVDGGTLSDSGEFTVTILGENDPPEISSPGDQGHVEDDSFQIYGLSVSDVDAIESTNEVQISISVDSGQLSLYTTNQLTFISGDGALDSEMTFSGVIPAVNSALNGFSFLGNSHYNGEDTITVQISDLGNTGTGNILLQEVKMGVYLNAVNDPPVNQLNNGEDAPPQISVLGTEITATPGSWNDKVDTDISLTSSNIMFEYQWQRNSINCTNGLYDHDCNDDGSFLQGGLCGDGSECQLEDDYWIDIIEENLETYEIKNSDAQKYIRVKVTATDDGVGLPSQQFTIAFSDFHYVDNSAPIPQNIGYNIYEDTVLTEDAPGILVNDSDPDDDAISAEVVVYPKNGEVNLSLNGSFVYTPNENFNGIDQFEYQVYDGALYGNDNAFVSITISSVNDIPVFTSGGNVESSENSGFVEIFGWATDISDGDPEVPQALEFTLTALNPDLFEVQPAVDPVSGTLSYAAFDNLNEDSDVEISLKDNGGLANEGVDETELIAFNINIIPINDSPSFTAGDVITVLEDSGDYSQFSWATDIDDGDGELVQDLSFSILSNDNSLLFVEDNLPAIDESGNISFTPAQNKNGTAQVVIALIDGGSAISPNSNISSEETLIINIVPVNDIPVWTVGGEIEILEDAGPQTNVSFVTGIDDGDPEVTQELTFVLHYVSDESLFAELPAIDVTGTLTYLINEDRNGSSEVQFKLQDDGGTDNGVVDLTSAQTFNIEVLSVNDAPIFVLGTLGQQINTIDADEDLYTEIGIEVSPVDIPYGEGAQVITYSLDSYEAIDASGDVFAILSIDENEGTISIYPIENGNGSDIITVTAQDNSGIEYGGIEEYQQVFSINVNPLNDPPEFNIKEPVSEDLVTNEEGISLPEDFSSRIYSMELLPAPENESTQDVLFSCNCDDIDFADISINSITGHITFQNITDDNGSIDLIITATDDGSIDNEGDINSYTQLYPLIINPVNDIPSFIKGDDQLILEDEVEVSISWATDISPGPTDEISQILTFNVITDDDSFFKDSQIPIIDINGNLTYEIADDKNGEIDVTITLADNGGIEFDGVDESESQTFKISVQAVNDPPSFVLGTNSDLEINEDGFENSSGLLKSVSGWTTDISKGPIDEVADVLTFNITSSKFDSTIFSIFPQIDEESGKIEYSINPDYNGLAEFTINLTDDGGVENGGADTSLDTTFSVWVHQVNDIPKAFEIHPRVFEYAKDNSTFYFDVDTNSDTTDIFYRLPYQVFAPPVQPDSLLKFSWVEDDSLDVDTYATWNFDSLFRLYYRLEAIPSDNSKTFVLKDDIDSQLYMEFDSVYVYIDMTSKFPVYTGEFNPDSLYTKEHLDTTGVTQYSWNVVAQNYLKDRFNNDPVRSVLSDVDLKIDLELPSAEMAFFQSELYSEYYDLYFMTNEETIDSVARVWIDFDTYTQSLFPRKMGDSLYYISSTFVSTGTVNYNFQVRDKRLNLGRSLDTVKYGILIPELARIVSSPDNVLEMYVPENAVQFETPVIISVLDVNEELSKNNVEIVSREYSIMANSLLLLKPATLSFKRPENFIVESFYKYSIVKLYDNNIEVLDTQFEGEVLVTSIIRPGNYTVVYNSEAVEPLPEKFALGNIYPNPFNPSTTIEFAIPEDNMVMIDIYNLRGQHVQNLMVESINPGYHSVVWSGVDNMGRMVPSGIYFVQIKFANQLISKKVTLLK